MTIVRPGGRAARRGRPAFLAALALTTGAVPATARPADASPRLAVQPSAAHARELRLSLPRPTGRLPVGVRATFVTDPARTDPTTGTARAVPIRVWYPARRRSDRPIAPYLSPALQAVVEPAISVPTGLLDVDTHATVEPPARGHIRGVILVQPGFGQPVATQTGLVVDLASRGYAVVTMDHPHDTFVVEQPDGTLIGADPSLPVEAAFTERVLDALLVLDHLERLVPEARPSTPIGMFGHSLGGAASAEVMLRDPRVVAGVDLDGTLFGDVVTAGLDRPFGVMLARDHTPARDPKLATFLSALRGPHPVRALDVLHNGYTDFVVFNPQAARIDAALGAHLEAGFPTGTVTSVRAGRCALARQRSFLAAFMRRHLDAAPH